MKPKTIIKQFVIPAKVGTHIKLGLDSYFHRNDKK